jgi:hypothetical protein
MIRLTESLRVSRRFHLSERMQVETLVEPLNVLNNAHLWNW